MMASRLYQDMKVETPGGIATYDAECSSDHQGKALFAVYGENDRDQVLTSEYRKETVEQLQDAFQKDTGREVNDIDLLVSRGTNILEGSKVEWGADKEITRAVADQASSVTIEVASQIGAYLDAKDWANQQDISSHGFNRSNEPPDISR